MMFFARWLLIATLLVWWIGLALMAAGCAKYVPVAVNLPNPKSPAECDQKFVRPRAIPAVLPVDAEKRADLCGTTSVPVCLAKMWAAREREWRAAAREKDADDQVCRSFTSKFR